MGKFTRWNAIRVPQAGCICWRRIREFVEAFLEPTIWTASPHSTIVPHMLSTAMLIYALPEAYKKNNLSNG